ncbi:hypothetical protein Tco_1547096 [Tanacetum coccineum]
MDIHDPNEMVDIPDNVDLVDYDGDDEENPEERTKTIMGLRSSDYVSSALCQEEREADVAPEDTFGTITQRPYAIRDFPRGVFEVGEPSSAHDSSYVGGLAPWALRRDL